MSALETAMPSSPQRIRNPIARINGVAVNDTALLPEELRQRACTELLRQAAQKAGLLDAADAASTDGAISEAATAAIEALLERELQVPEPAEEDCFRYYTAHKAQYRTGERVRVRHILFAVTPGVDVVALRKRAEAALLDVRCYADEPAEATGKRPDEPAKSAGERLGKPGEADDSFAGTAGKLSNCPSGAEGGELGWLEAADCAPEFARELFGHAEVGVLPRLVHSRFGLHVVDVQERQPGEGQPFEAVRNAVVLALRRQTYVTAMRQYLMLLAGSASVEGVDLDAADTPLVQ
jgi:peptidyl-prolyl cis-trans isomerase C